MKIYKLLFCSVLLSSCAGQKIDPARSIASKNQEIAEVSGLFKVASGQNKLCDIGEVEVKEDGANTFSIIAKGLLNEIHSVYRVNEGIRKDSPDAFVWQETKAVLKDGALKDYHKGCNGFTSLCLNIRKFNLETFIEFKDKKMIVHGGIYDYFDYAKNPVFTAFYSDKKDGGKPLKCVFDRIK